MLTEHVGNMHVRCNRPHDQSNPGQFLFWVQVSCPGTVHMHQLAALAVHAVPYALSPASPKPGMM